MRVAILFFNLCLLWTPYTHSAGAAEQAEKDAKIKEHFSGLFSMTGQILIANHCGVGGSANPECMIGILSVVGSSIAAADAINSRRTCEQMTGGDCGGGGGDGGDGPPNNGGDGEIKDWTYAPESPPNNTPPPGEEPPPNNTPPPGLPLGTKVNKDKDGNITSLQFKDTLVKAPFDRDAFAEAGIPGVEFDKAMEEFNKLREEVGEQLGVSSPTQLKSSITGGGGGFSGYSSYNSNDEEETSGISTSKFFDLYKSKMKKNKKNKKNISFKPISYGKDKIGTAHDNIFQMVSKSYPKIFKSKVASF